MDFRTTIEAPKYPFSIGYDTPTLFCGSCFTENIGSLLGDRKMPVLVNPFGVVYNPISVKMVLERIVKGNPLAESDLSFRNGLWYSYLHHTTFSSIDKNACLSKINLELQIAHDFVKGTQNLIVTFGTARVYYLKENNQPVANCHKVPAKEFDNRLIEVDEIVQEWSELLNGILRTKPDLKIIFTVSPVRHWKDGAVGNQLSKSILHVAIHQLVDKYKNTAFYFPAYELLMDDLRDYRYYADDMLHPSKVAVEYIWEKFKDSFLDRDSVTVMAEVEKILLAVNHRPFNPNTPEHRAFVKRTMEQIQRIKVNHPHINLSEEEQILSK